MKTGLSKSIREMHKMFQNDHKLWLKFQKVYCRKFGIHATHDEIVKKVMIIKMLYLKS